MIEPPDKAGLLWVGSKFYPTPAGFVREVRSMGLSRRIPSVPKDFVIGETWVFLAHREAIWDVCTACNGFKVDKRTHDDCEGCGGKGMTPTPGVFQVSRPDRIEVVVEEGCTDEEAERFEKRGLTPVIIDRVPAQRRTDGGEDAPD